MRFQQYLFEAKIPFLGTCDRIRKPKGGEEFWQCMMKNKSKISEKEFLRKVNLKEMLDDDETWEEWKQSQSDKIKYFKSSDDTYFLQTAGFEFIFKVKK